MEDSYYIEEYDMVLEWDVKKAEHYYVLRKKKVIRHESFTATKKMVQIAKGDMAWAVATAAHFNVELPDNPQGIPRQKLHLVDIGYAEDTVIYELVPIEVARLSQEPLSIIEAKLKELGARNLLIDGGCPKEADEMLMGGFNVIKGRVPAPHQVNPIRF